MISPRQKTRTDDAAPVLFRLPNLRTRGTKPTIAAVVTSPEALPEFVPAPVMASPAAKEPVVSQPVVEQARPAASISPVFEMPGSSPYEPFRFDTVSAGVAAPHVAPSVPSGRSWMEQVGSRMILIITLLIIVTAAWITGQRMPAPKPSVEPENSVAVTEVDPAESPTATIEQTPEKATPESDTKGTLLAGPAETPLATETTKTLELIDPTTPLSTGEEQAKTSIVVSESPVTELLPPGAVSPSIDLGAPIQDQTPYQASKPSSQDSLLAPPPYSVASTSTPDIDSFYAPDDVPAKKTSGTPAMAVGLKTQTPNEPSIDPNVLVPWASENTAALSHLQTATPNPITDWSRYFPAPPAGSNVLTTSGTESTGMPMTQQTVYPPNASAYESNFYQPTVE